MTSQQASGSALGRSSTIPTTDSGRIVLIDHTGARNGLARADSASTDYDASETEAMTTPLHTKLTSGSLGLQQSVRNQVARQKYRRYDRDRYDLDQSGDIQTDTESSQVFDDAGLPTRQLSYIERSRTKAKKFLKRKKRLGTGKDKEDTVIDVLWENQRGSFLFGIPRYSANSLLPSDPKSWQNAEFRTSPVDIRNAQVPDPSWEWTWKSWYVDMSRDVDEEGWEYSLAFKINFSWHGNHPWFHSFVRRRRWLRMRSRKNNAQHGSINKQDPHDLASEYFTIHPQARATTDAEGPSQIVSHTKDEYAGEEVEISNIGQLMLALRRANLDREKLSAIRNFLVNGEGEIGYLHNQMSDVLGMLIYQTSRRQVLTELVALRSGRFGEEPKGEETKPAPGEPIQNVLAGSSLSREYLDRAIEAAKTEICRLEYWSDVKNLEGSDTIENLEISETGKTAFSSKQAAQEPGNSLHKHPEHDQGDGNRDIPCKDADLPKALSPTRKSKTESLSGDDDDTDLERYTTAAESASEMNSSRSRGRRQKTAAGTRSEPLGGVDEEEN